jgi:hypothetical protein
MICRISWVMPIAEAQAAGLPQNGTRDLAESWCHTGHAEPVEATHKVRVRFDDGGTSEWFPCCTAHAEYAKVLAMHRWEVTPSMTPAKVDDLLTKALVLDKRLALVALTVAPKPPIGRAWRSTEPAPPAASPALPPTDPPQT